MSIKTWFTLIGFIILSQGAGVVGSLFTASSVDGWYSMLIRPDFAPPNWVFGPVWITLYTLMGFAAFIVWKRGFRRRDVRIALSIFVVQLVLNMFWSIIFFGLESPGGAFVEIIFLWVAILATIVAFAKVSKLAALLLLPYIIWVSFAMYLNFSIWVLN